MVAKINPLDKAGGQPAVSVDPEDKIAAELRNAREASGKSFSDLHRLTGLSRTTLHQYESGTRKPGAREIRLLCDALGVTPNRLIYGAEEPFKEKSRLHALLGVTNEDLRTARLAILLTMLSKEERDAWITLLGESLKARTGGGGKLDEALNAIQAATEVMASDMANIIQEALPDDKIAKMGKAIEERLSPKGKPKRSRQP